MLPNKFFHITLHTLTSLCIFSKLFSMMLTRRICFKFNNQELISLVIVSFILVTFIFDIRDDIVRRNYVLAILRCEKVISFWKFTVHENTACNSVKKTSISHVSWFICITLYILTSVCIFSQLFSIHFLRCR